MRPTLSLIRREFTAYFTGPTGYAALFGFLVLTGLLFNLNLRLAHGGGAGRRRVPDAGDARRGRLADDRSDRGRAVLGTVPGRHRHAHDALAGRGTRHRKHRTAPHRADPRLAGGVREVRRLLLRSTSSSGCRHSSTSRCWPICTRSGSAVTTVYSVVMLAVGLAQLVLAFLLLILDASAMAVLAVGLVGGDLRRRRRIPALHEGRGPPTDSDGRHRPGADLDFVPRRRAGRGDVPRARAVRVEPREESTGRVDVVAVARAGVRLAGTPALGVRVGHDGLLVRLLRQRARALPAGRSPAGRSIPARSCST